VPKPATAQEEPRLAVQVKRDLKDKEPSWRCNETLQTGHVPLVPSEKSILPLVCHREVKGVGFELVEIFIYQVDDSVEAEKWLNPVRTGQVAEGWRVELYDLGDEGYLSTFTSGERFDIEFRKGNIVAKIDGPELDTIKRMAKYVEAEIEAASKSDND
jgi:hypothetical protein